MIDIRWDDKYLVGHPRIDHEHQVFVDLIRSVSIESDQPGSRERILRMLQEVKKYAEFHFFSEESIMLEVAYPEYASHQNEHKLLLATLENEIYRYRNSDMALAHLANFLFEWFALHTSKVDLRLTRYIAQHQFLPERVAKPSAQRRLAPPLDALTFPVIAAPLFIISNPQLLIAQCTAGVLGALPALNARPAQQLDEWLREITQALAAYNLAHPQAPAAPFAINQIVHKSNARLQQDMALCAKYKVPVIITSLGAREEVNAAAHSYGGVVLHDVINNRHAHKAIEKGADGLIAVAAGAGGHAGVKSPFALVQEIRQWFDGPLALSGSIASGDAVLAAQACGADFAYIGSAFIATDEARASAAYKQAIVDASSDDIVYSNLFTGVHGNYLASSIRAAGLDPQHLPESDPSQMDFATDRSKAWKDIWGCGQGIAAVTQVQSTADLVARLRREYQAARKRLAC